MDNLKVKYAVMEVKDDIGYDVISKETMTKDNVVAYMVSKCYVISETIDYIKGMTTYEVVFPYSRVGYSGRFARNQNVDLQNKVVVDEVFDSYEDALISAGVKNAGKIRENVMRYNIISKQLDDQNYDMIVGKNDFDFNRIIEKISEDPQRFYAEIASILSLEERDYIKRLIENKTCNNCTNMTCGLENNDKSRFDSCIAWDNKELIGRKVFQKNRTNI